MDAVAQYSEITRTRKIALAAGAVATVSLGVYAFYMYRLYKRFMIAPPLRGGMSVGHDSSSINMASRFHEEDESERDVVDQAIYESFICSDPPAY